MALDLFDLIAGVGSMNRPDSALAALHVDAVEMQFEFSSFHSQYTTFEKDEPVWSTPTAVDRLQALIQTNATCSEISFSPFITCAGKGKISSQAISPRVTSLRKWV